MMRGSLLAGLAVLTCGYAHAGISLLAHTASGHAAGGTSSAIDTTGATLLVVFIGDQTTGGSTATVSDSQSNTWNYIRQNSCTTIVSTLAYSYSKGAGALSTSASHTITVSDASGFPAFGFSAWSGTETGASNPLDQHTMGCASNSQVQPGSITPTQPNSLVITTLGNYFSAIASINSGMSVINYVPAASGTNYLGASAYLVQSSGAPINPTWSTDASGAFEASVIASFLPAAAGSSSKLSLLGVGL